MSRVRLLEPEAVARALAVRDLTDPASGPHALQLLVDDVGAVLARSWRCAVRVHRGGPVVPVEDHYDRLGYPPDAIARDARYTRYVSETCVLRAHTSAMVPGALRSLAAEPGGPPADVMVMCPGITFRRDAVDRLHTATPHQLDLWRIVAREMTGRDLDVMIRGVLRALLPGMRHRTTPASHPYTRDGRQIDVLDDDRWVEVGECGLAAPAVLARAGLDVTRHSGLAMGIGLDRVLMLRKGIPDIRLLRSADPRVTSQLADVGPYRPVSSHPPVVRDLSVAVDAGDDAESMGDRVREALGEDAACVESVEVLDETPAARLTPVAAERLGIGLGQRNLLVRVVLRHPVRTLTRREANDLRDRVHAAIHRGAATVPRRSSPSESHFGLEDRPIARL